MRGSLEDKSLILSLNPICMNEKNTSVSHRDIVRIHPLLIVSCPDTTVMSTTEKPVLKNKANK